ncbi:hypothetical protein PG987_000112 [Apiospora arundinis]
MWFTSQRLTSTIVEISDLQARSVKAAERPSLKRQADFDSSDNKRSKIDLPNRSASAFSQPRQLRGASPRKPQTHANSGDEDVDEGADHRDDENFEDPAEELAENPAEKSEVEEDTKDAADKDPAIPISPTPATAGARINTAGIQISLYHYQAMGVLILLMQQTSEGISGGLLANDMGMGKTLQMLAFMVIHEHLV